MWGQAPERLLKFRHRRNRALEQNARPEPRRTRPPAARRSGGFQGSMERLPREVQGSDGVIGGFWWLLLGILPELGFLGERERFLVAFA